MLSEKANELKQEILDAQVDYQDVHRFLQSCKMDNIDATEYNRINQTDYSQEDFEAATEDLKHDVEIGWRQRLEDVASGDWQNDFDTRRTFDNDRDSPFYEKYLRDASISEIEEFSRMTVEDARKEIKANGTLF